MIQFQDSKIFQTTKYFILISEQSVIKVDFPKTVNSQILELAGYFLLSKFHVTLQNLVLIQIMIKNGVDDDKLCNDYLPCYKILQSLTPS